MSNDKGFKSNEGDAAGSGPRSPEYSSLADARSGVLPPIAIAPAHEPLLSDDKILEMEIAHENALRGFETEGTVYNAHTEAMSYAGGLGFARNLYEVQRLELIAALENIAGIDPWITDEKIRKHFAATVYPALHKALGL